jgi:hypothetical protein
MEQRIKRSRLNSPKLAVAVSLEIGIVLLFAALWAAEGSSASNKPWFNRPAHRNAKREGLDTRGWLLLRFCLTAAPSLWCELA